MGAKLIGGVVATLLLFGTLPSQASTLVDDGGYTVDTATGLQWLDVSTTIDESYNEVSSELADASTALYGYRYATGDEISQLVADAGVTSSLDCYSCSPNDAFVNLQSLLGPTGVYSDEVIVRGLISDGAAEGSHFFTVMVHFADENNIIIHDAYTSDNSTDPSTGSFLVKNVASTPPPIRPTTICQRPSRAGLARLEKETEKHCLPHSRMRSKNTTHPRKGCREAVFFSRRSCCSTFNRD